MQCIHGMNREWCSLCRGTSDHGQSGDVLYSDYGKVIARVPAGAAQAIEQPRDINPTTQRILDAILGLGDRFRILDLDEPLGITHHGQRKTVRNVVNDMVGRGELRVGIDPDDARVKIFSKINREDDEVKVINEPGFAEPGKLMCLNCGENEGRMRGLCMKCWNFWKNGKIEHPQLGKWSAKYPTEPREKRKEDLIIPISEYPELIKPLQQATRDEMRPDPAYEVLSIIKKSLTVRGYLKEKEG